MSNHMQREIGKLKKRILSVSAMVEEALINAIKSLVQQDRELAESVIENDAKIDHLEVEVEEECLKILALHQPVAIDLRFIVSVLKINNDLERIADLAVNIAERAESLSGRGAIEVPEEILQMCQMSQAMLKESIESLVNLDHELANKVCAADDAIDDLHCRMYEITDEHIKGDPSKMGTWIQFLTVSRCLERVADHATNIAEDVMYMINGEISRHRG